MLPKARFSAGFAIVSGLAVLLLAPASGSMKRQASPSVSISLPADMASETVEIRYFMIGAFGGYGGYLKPEPNLHSYRIDASVDGRPAETIKILVYASGCRIQTYDLSFSEKPALDQNFSCEAVGDVTLTGQIPRELISQTNSELTVRYLAFWANRFFGVADGAVPEIQLGAVVPNQDGAFRVSFTDFTAGKEAPMNTQDAALQLFLRDSKTWNRLAPSLIPELQEYRSASGFLKIMPAYPGVLHFAPDPRWQSF